MHVTRYLLLSCLFTLAACDPNFEYEAGEAETRTISEGWPEYGGGQGQRYVNNTEITKDNIKDLELAWIYKTGDVSDGSDPAIASTSAFELTPITADGKLIICTPFNRVIALDPLNGGELWQFDPEIDLSGRYANQLVCRGVTHWQDPGAEPGSACASRIFTATNDGYLIAIDTDSGSICPGFGANGRVNLNKGAGDQKWLGEYQVTSPPAVISVTSPVATSDTSKRPVGSNANP